MIFFVLKPLTFFLGLPLLRFGNDASGSGHKKNH